MVARFLKHNLTLSLPAQELLMAHFLLQFFVQVFISFYFPIADPFLLLKSVLDSQNVKQIEVRPLRLKWTWECLWIPLFGGSQRCPLWNGNGSQKVLRSMCSKILSYLILFPLLFSLIFSLFPSLMNTSGDYHISSSFAFSILQFYFFNLFWEEALNDEHHKYYYNQIFMSVSRPKVKMPWLVFKLKPTAILLLLLLGGGLCRVYF